MNELRRTAYLDALGIEQFLPRVNLPGARASRRTLRAGTEPPQSAEAVIERSSRPQRLSSRNEGEVAAMREGLEAQPKTGSDPTPSSAKAELSSAERSEVADVSLVFIKTGAVIWLGVLSVEHSPQAQQQLILGIARALSLDAGITPLVETLTWPPVGGLKLGSLHEFVHSRVLREIQSDNELTLVALGSEAQEISASVEGCIKISALSATEMLQSGEAKRLAWKSLRALRSR